MIIGRPIPAEMSIMIEQEIISNKHATTQTCEISTHPYLKEAAFRSRTSRHDTCADYNILLDYSTQKPSSRSCNNKYYALRPRC